MQLDWNIEEIAELKKRACLHGADRAVTRHLGNLEAHLKSHQSCINLEVRKTLWESVEDSATKLDRLLTPEPTVSRKTANYSIFGIGLWMPDAPKVGDFEADYHRLAPRLELLR